jgi:hypothetical protein
LADFGADGGDPLGEFGCDQETAGESLVVELLELFELAGFESFQGAENSLDGCCPQWIGVGIISYFEWSGGRSTTAATFLWDCAGNDVIILYMRSKVADISIFRGFI